MKFYLFIGMSTLLSIGVVPENIQNNSDLCKPTLPNLESFCGEVGGKSPLDFDDNYIYAYQRTMDKCACVDREIDSDHAANIKLRIWWNLFRKRIVCDSTRFNVTNGSIVKYAIYNKFEGFVDDIIYANLDINFIDDSDGMTVMDYLKNEINKNISVPPVQKILEDFYIRLRVAGAKHAHELQ